MFGADFLDSGLYVAQIIAIAVGLWLGFSLERTVSVKLIGLQHTGSRSGRALRVVTWMGLGYLLSLPFLQVFQVLHSLLQASLPQYGSATLSGIAWGMAPYWLWAVLKSLAMLVVYTVFVSLALPRLKSKIEAIDPGEISEITAIVVVFSAGSIVWNAVNTLFSLVLRPELPVLQLTSPERGIIGFLGGWLIAILIVLTIAFYHNFRQSDLVSTDASP